MDKSIRNIVSIVAAVLLIFSVPISYSAVKNINIDDSRVSLPKGYSLFISGVCRDGTGKYGLVEFSMSSNVIITLPCSPKNSVSSSSSPYFAKISRSSSSETFLQIATPINSGRFYFYIAQTANAPNWTILNTDSSGNLKQPNVAELLKNKSPLYPFAVIEITKDSTGKQTYYADGTLIDGVSPLFASITLNRGDGSNLISGYAIPTNIKTSDIIKTIIAACHGTTVIPSKSLCQANLTSTETDSLGNQWLIAPTQLPAKTFSAPLNANTQTYLNALNGISWSKSSYCGTFKVGGGVMQTVQLAHYVQHWGSTMVVAVGTKHPITQR